MKQTTIITSLLLIFVQFIFSVNNSKVYSQQIVINEVMSSNDDCCVDEDDDNEDWVELYNAGNKEVSLEGLGLSDDLEKPMQWVFPDTTIEAGDYLIVWCSGKDRALGNEKLSFWKKFGLIVQEKDITEIPRPLHTNFKIKAKGEPILLSNASGEVIDKIPSVEIPEDISYGPYPDGNNKQYYFFSEPTPGKANNQKFYEDSTL